jgi:hypothetical protein
VRRKLRNEGVAETAKALARRFAGMSEEDKHIWHPTYSELSELFAFAGFSIDKVHWQKPPYDHVVFMLGSKASLPTATRPES